LAKNSNKRRLVIQKVFDLVLFYKLILSWSLVIFIIIGTTKKQNIHFWYYINPWKEILV